MLFALWVAALRKFRAAAEIKEFVLKDNLNSYEITLGKFFLKI